MKGITGLVALLIALGLILRFGKTSATLFGTAGTTAVGLVNALSLSTWQGNTPN